MSSTDVRNALALLSLLAALLAVPAWVAAQERCDCRVTLCAPAEPREATLTGRVMVARGPDGGAGTRLVLVPARAVCVQVPAAEPGQRTHATRARTLLLVTVVPSFQRWLRGLVGRQVTLRGPVRPRSTEQHHPALVLEVRATAMEPVVAER